MNTSKKSLSAVAACLALTLAAGASLAHAGDHDFVVVNRTGKELARVNASPAGKKDWGPQILSAPLKDGQSAKVEFNREAAECKWDLKAGASSETLTVWQGVDLCNAREITLRFEGKNPVISSK